MKLKIVYLAFVLFSGFNVVAQTSVKTAKIITKEIPVYRDVDVLASYRGGYEVLLKRIEEATKNCKKGKFKGKEAAVVIDVLISDQGKVVKVDFINDTVSLCYNDIRSAIEKSDQWIPARIQNKPVNSYIQLTVNLKNN